MTPLSKETLEMLAEGRQQLDNYERLSKVKSQIDMWPTIRAFQTWVWNHKSQLIQSAERVAELEAENERLKADNARLRFDLDEAKSMIAEPDRGN